MAVKSPYYRHQSLFMLLGAEITSPVKLVVVKPIDCWLLAFISYVLLVPPTDLRLNC